MCGKILYLKAWKNILNIDYNPGNWMKYYFNDLAFNSHIEEFGKVLILPRNLYKYTTRNDSISFKKYDINEYDLLRNEGEQIKQNALIRRGKDIKTIIHKFDKIYEQSFAFIDSEFSFLNTQQKINFYSSSTSLLQHKKLKELYFDHDLYFNSDDLDFDWVFFYIRTKSDFILLKNKLPKILKNKNKIRICVNRFYENTEQEIETFKDYEKWLSETCNYTVKCYGFCYYEIYPY